MEKPLSKPKELKKLLYSLVKKTKSEMERHFLEAEIGITPLQYAVLVLLQEAPSTINELARVMIFRPPTLVPVVDSLEQEGYLSREPDEQDRRKIQLIITQKGQEMVAKNLLDDATTALHTSFMQLSPEKRELLLELLTELDTNFSI